MNYAYSNRSLDGIYTVVESIEAGVSVAHERAQFLC